MATTKATIRDLARQIQNKSARARVKVLLDALCDAYDAMVTGSAGFLTANDAGRAVMATGYFIAATVLDKFGAGSIDATAAASIIATGAITQDKLAQTAAPTTRSGAGAIDPTRSLTLFTSTGAGNALTLANGTYAGQEVTVIHSVKGTSGTGVITPTTFDHTSVTLTNVFASVNFIWTGSTWTIRRLIDATVTG